MPRKVSEEVTLEELQALRRSVLLLLEEVDSMIAAKEAAITASAGDRRNPALLLKRKGAYPA